MAIIGFGGLDHNGSVTVIEDTGDVRFLELERLTRIKNQGIDGPDVTLQLLDRLKADSASVVAIADLTWEAQRRDWLQPLVQNRFSAPIEVWQHHDCHAASALIASAWSSALCITIDGKGDNLSATASLLDTKQGIVERIFAVPSAHSLGRLWWGANQERGVTG